MTRAERQRKTDEALRILKRRRIHPVTMDAVARRLGVSKPTLYRYLAQRWAEMQPAA